MNQTNNKKIWMIVGIVAAVFVVLLFFGSVLFGFLMTKIGPNNIEPVKVEKYHLKLNIDFQENLFFSKYNINMKLNDETKLLNHGEKYDFDFELEKGTYTIYFEKDEDADSDEEEPISNKYEFSIDKNLNLGLLLKSKMTSIEVSKVYEYKDGEVSEAEQYVLDFTSVDLSGKKYKDVVKDLEEKGFTNIKTKPVYDINLGITPEKSVKKVSIDGSTDYKKGDIVFKDTKVIVYYHMSADKDPNKEKSTVEDTSEEETSKESAPAVDPNSAYYHSSNSKAVALQGNTGAYAYARYGKAYDNYMIINLDEHTVYQFTERNNDNTGFITTNLSGNLKNGLDINWIFPDSSGTDKAHFKNNNPEDLYYVDNDGFVIDWEPANYQKVLAYKNQHTFS